MYSDRGIIKWAPFDALVGFHAMIQDIQYQLGKSPKPLLCEDRLQEMNRHLTYAIQKQQDVFLVYYVDGYFKQVYGRIKKIDVVNSLLILDTYQKINLLDIVQIQTEGLEDINQIEKEGTE